MHAYLFPLLFSYSNSNINFRYCAFIQQICCLFSITSSLPLPKGIKFLSDRAQNSMVGEAGCAFRYDNIHSNIITTSDILCEDLDYTHDFLKREMARGSRLKGRQMNSGTK